MCLDQSGYLNKNYFPGPAPSGIRRAINPNSITGTEMECSCTLLMSGPHLLISTSSGM